MPPLFKSLRVSAAIPPLNATTVVSHLVKKHLKDHPPRPPKRGSRGKKQRKGWKRWQIILLILGIIGALALAGVTLAAAKGTHDRHAYKRRANGTDGTPTPTRPKRPTRKKVHFEDSATYTRRNVHKGRTIRGARAKIGNPRDVRVSQRHHTKGSRPLFVPGQPKRRARSSRLPTPPVQIATGGGIDINDWMRHVHKTPPQKQKRYKWGEPKVKRGHYTKKYKEKLKKIQPDDK